jgi:hypothetical protein
MMILIQQNKKKVKLFNINVRGTGTPKDRDEVNERDV